MRWSRATSAHPAWQNLYVFVGGAGGAGGASVIAEQRCDAVERLGTRAAVRLLEKDAIDAALTPAAIRALPEESKEAIRRALIRLRERTERISDALGRA